MTNANQTRTTQTFASPGTALVIPSSTPTTQPSKDRGRYSQINTTHRGRY